jgi:hypothetical protein
MAGKKARTHGAYNSKMGTYWNVRQDLFNKRRRIQKHINFLTKKVVKLAAKHPVRVLRIQAEIERAEAALELTS